MTTTRLVLTTLLLALLLPACGGTSDAGGVASPSGADGAAQRLATEALDDFGCGHGFTVGTPDQAVRLSVFADGGFGEPPAPGTVQVGDGWTGELVVGSDLFAQWCDDVMEPDEPEVVQDDVWTVTGTLTWELVEGDGACPSVAAGTLTEARAATDEGEVTLPDVELRNESFGCFAG